MINKPISTLISIFILLITSCNSAPAQTVEVTRLVAQTVEVTRLIPQTAVVTQVVTATPLSSSDDSSRYRATLTNLLVERVYFDPKPALPAGLSVTVYRVNQSIKPEDVGYSQIRDELKERSRWVALKYDTYDYSDARLSSANTALKPFGYRFERTGQGAPQNVHYVLYHGDQKTIENVEAFGPVSVNRSKNDFVMIVKAINQGSFEVRSRSVVHIPFESYPTPDGIYPQFLGDDLLYAKIENDGGKAVVRIYQNNLPIYQTFSDVIHARSQLYALWTYGNHWAVEVLDGVSIDGQDMNQRHNYQKSYEFFLMAGKPVYLFEKDGKLGLNFKGQEVMLGGQSALHYGCCSNSMLNPSRLNNMMVFFMQNEGRWYYVEVEAK
jgi:hypothetical protein